MAIYATSDWHGYLDAYHEVKKRLKPEDVVYFLGDATDRGPDPWGTVRAIAADHQFIYLKGNHEQMAELAMKQYFGDKYDYYDRVGHLTRNGGLRTYNEWVIMSYDEKKRWLKFFEELPLNATVKTDTRTYLLTHAGFTPNPHIEGINFPGPRACLWDRDHINYPWTGSEYYIVHGHTPASFFTGNYGKNQTPTIYAKGHKINVDLGTPTTKEICLYNLTDNTYEIISLENK